MLNEKNALKLKQKMDSIPNKIHADIDNLLTLSKFSHSKNHHYSIFVYDNNNLRICGCYKGALLQHFVACVKLTFSILNNDSHKLNNLKEKFKGFPDKFFTIKNSFCIFLQLLLDHPEYKKILQVEQFTQFTN